MRDDHQPAPRDIALVEKEAVAWFTRINGRPSRSERRDFAAWLDASADNRIAYEKLGALWGNLGAVADTVSRKTPGELEEPLRIIEEYRRQSQATRRGGAIAGCLAVLVAGAWIWLEKPNLLQDMQADYITERGERREIALADGSTVLLDADSALENLTSARERRVRLLRGGAFFSVKPSPVPFVVEAENGEARVLGTTFDVVLDADDSVKVTLSTGKVAVAADQDHGVILSPGQSVAYDTKGLQAVHAVDLAESSAWREGRLIFTEARLADVLAQIGRYRSGRIILMDKALGERRVSGNISLEDTNKALAALRASVGFNIIAFGEKVTLIGR